MWRFCCSVNIFTSNNGIGICYYIYWPIMRPRSLVNQSDTIPDFLFRSGKYTDLSRDKLIWGSGAVVEPIHGWGLGCQKPKPKHRSSVRTAHSNVHMTALHTCVTQYSSFYGYYIDSGELWTCTFAERKFQAENVCSMRTFAPTSFRSQELSSPGTIATGNENSMELLLPISKLGRLTLSAMAAVPTSSQDRRTS